MQELDRLKSVIGLEIHVQLRTLSKMFCACANDPNETIPNVNVCPICLGHPGTLPTANAEAIRKVVQVGLALNCKISSKSEFTRKSYFYADLPKGYQISQADNPLCSNGFLNISNRRIRIQRIHLEEDTGRLAHEKGISLVDFNRAGLPLMELVTEPDFCSGKEVDEFARELQLILRYLNASDADMEKGEMRIEANVSVQLEKDPHASGTKVELKNINSFHAVRDAINYEIARQSDLINCGEKIVQETRGWNGQSTILQRKKEIAQEYRYFPEPDLPPIRLSEKEIEDIKNGLPELPEIKRQRFSKEYFFVDSASECRSESGDFESLIRDINLGYYFEKTASELLSWMKDEKISHNKSGILIKLLLSYLTTDLKSMLNEVSINDIKITPENFAELIILIFQNKISSRIAKDVLREMFNTGRDPSHIVESKNLVQIDDEPTIRILVLKILSEYPKLKDDYRKGKLSVMQFLIGQLMKETRGAVEPDLARKIIEEELNKY